MDEFTQRVIASLEESAVDKETLREPKATIRPPASGQPRGLLARIQNITAKQPFLLRELLGEGGMGMVYLGKQRCLEREVAIKTVRPELVSERTVDELIREAWIVGALEHPNVVPVHDIQFDPEGKPHVLLKRIEGDNWSELMRDEVAMQKRTGGDDLLEQNLHILLQVCNAVQFAHARGIVHRDLKPDNVMVGEFGEIYVLDWGLGVALHDDGSGKLPLACDAREIAGTLAYMAPEMLGEGVLGAHTDTYLLGAILFEIVAGRPPHHAESLPGLVAMISVSEPELPVTISPELAAIVRKAMSRKPEDRYAAAADFRQAVVGFLSHRVAAGFAASGRASEQRLRVCLEEEGGLDPQHLYELYSQCRFSFQQAAQRWPEHEDAPAGLLRLTELMVDFELGRGAPAAARGLLAGLGSPPLALSQRVAEAVGAEQARTEQLERVHRVQNPETGVGLRGRLTFYPALLWVLSPLVLEASRRSGRLATHASAITWDSLLLLAFLIGGYWFRLALSESAVTRNVWVGLVATAGSQLLLHIGDVINGTDALTTTRTQFLVWAVILSMLALPVDRRVLVPAAVYALLYFALGFRPEYVFMAMTAGNAVLMLTSLSLSRPRQASAA